MGRSPKRTTQRASGVSWRVLRLTLCLGLGLGHFASADAQPAVRRATNIAAILKAYPQVRIRIGGYTDNTGDPGTNLRLSEERANNVMDELVKLGIDPARMSARGYGERNPVADNSTEDGRQKNRRISLRVTDQQAAV